MLHNPAKDLLLAGKPAYGYALALGSPVAAEALAGTGIDFIMIDGQHGSFGADATIATLGTPQEITVQEIRIESFFPIDGPTARFFREPSAVE